MTVGQVLALHEEARWVMAEHHIGGCSHCAIDESKTLEQICFAYGVEPGKLLDALNALLQPSPKRSR